MIDLRDEQTMELMELDLHEAPVRHSSARDFMGRLRLCASVHENGLRSLAVATPAWSVVAAAAAFFSEDNAIGETCYNAMNHLRQLEGEEVIGDEWQVICWRVQRRCKELIASGRVREPGRRRDVAGARRERARLAGQLSLDLGLAGVQL